MFYRQDDVGVARWDYDDDDNRVGMELKVWLVAEWRRRDERKEYELKPQMAITSSPL